MEKQQMQTFGNLDSPQILMISWWTGDHDALGTLVSVHPPSSFLFGFNGYSGIYQFFPSWFMLLFVKVLFWKSFFYCEFNRIFSSKSWKIIRVIFSSLISVLCKLGNPRPLFASGQPFPGTLPPDFEDHLCWLPGHIDVVVLLVFLSCCTAHYCTNVVVISSPWVFVLELP